MNRPKLPSSLLWKEGGHLTEEALTAIADGEEDLLPDDATTHASECEECARGMGEAAMLSASLGSALASVMADSRASAAPVSQRVGPPFWALILGLGFAGIGALPFLMGIPGWLIRNLVVLKRAVPVFAHGAVSLAGSEGVAMQRMVVTLGSLAVLMMSLFAVSRLTPREGVVR
jgi:anti-sigma factor RsiW